MKIVSLVENSSTCGLRTAHALSLYIETKGHKLLFDLGSDDTILENARVLGVDLTQVDTVVISHGHRDHGGALPLFLGLNHRAKIYVQRGAFRSHFSHRAAGVSDISLDASLATHPQVVLLDGDFELDDELKLFKVRGERKLWSGANSSLYEGDAVDSFTHEQNLLILGNSDSSVLIMGCGHNGIVNIMESVANHPPMLCVGGFHLTSPSANRDEPKELLDLICKELQRYSSTKFYTCHCTGERVFDYMKQQLPELQYLHCGELIEF